MSYDAWKTRSPDDGQYDPALDEDGCDDCYDTCPDCGGEGSVDRHDPTWDDPYYCTVLPCPTCCGSGWVCG